MRRWTLLPNAPAEFINQFPEVSAITAQLLFNRGITDEKSLAEFLHPDYATNLHDPFLFQDMEKAIGRIFDGIAKNEKITVHGDYDADGVTSAAVLVLLLQKLFTLAGKNHEHVSVYIPHREKEGYGLRPETVEYFKKQKVNLVVTCDCGISQVPEGKLCRDADIDLIITDHHQAPEILPAAYAIINPTVKTDKYPYSVLAGVGVAFKLIQGILARLDNFEQKVGKKFKGFNRESFEKWLLDLVAIGTVADCSPLVGENRTLVKYGLIVLNKTPRIGLQKLFAVAGVGQDGNGLRVNGFENLPATKGILNTYSISFQIAPRINAAGRLDHASVAYELIMSDEPTEAEKLADKINAQNLERQKLTEKMITEADEQVKPQLTANNKILFALGEGWTAGVVGLVAGKIAEKYYRPTFIMGRNDKKEIIGSGRSIPEFNQINALRKVEKYLVRYGGHSQACGFNLKDKKLLPEFQKDLEAVAQVELKNVELTREIKIDAVLKLDEFNWQLLNEVQSMEPFGEGNTRPVFIVKNVSVENLTLLGAEKQHLRLLVKQNDKTQKVIAFGFGDWYNQLKVGDKIDIVVDLNVNEWNGNRELQLKVIDLKLNIE